MVEPSTHKFASMAEELGFWKEQAERHQQRFDSNIKNILLHRGPLKGNLNDNHALYGYTHVSYL